MLTWILASLGMVALIVFLTQRDANSSLKAVAIKCIVSLFYILTALSAICCSKIEIKVCLLVIFGLVMGLLGDIWLDLKWIYPESKKYYLNGGFLMFLVGHLFYNYAMLILDGFNMKHLLISTASGIVVAVLVFILSKPLGMDMTGYKAITCIYTVFLFMFVSQTNLMNIAGGFNTGTMILFISSVCFFGSDLILAGTYFGENKTGKFYIITNHVLYYIAQFGIAISLMFLK